MEELELHWLVWVLEGKGTFLRGAPSEPGTPILRVWMTDRDVVEHVAKLFGMWRPSSQADHRAICSSAGLAEEWV